MALEISPQLEAAIAAADQQHAPLEELQLAGRLESVIGAHTTLSPASRRGTFTAVGALYFARGRQHRSPVWDMYWQPTTTWVDAEHVEHHSPDVNLVDDEIVAFWAQLSMKRHHPVLRARFADLAWELARYRERQAKNAGVPANERPLRPDAESARVAIDAYFAAIERRLASNDFRAWLFLARAIELAATIKDRARLDRGKGILFEFQASCEARESNFQAWQFDDIAWNQQNALGFGAIDKATVVAVLERALAIHSDFSDKERFDPHSAMDAADRLRRWREQGGERAEATRAAETAGAAFENIAKEASALTAVSWLSDQAARYRRDGNAAGAARVESEINRRAPEAKGELKVVSVPIDVPRKDLDDWSDRVAGENIEDGLLKLAAAGLIREGPTAARVRDLASHAPLMATISISVLRDDGFPSAVIGSVDDDLPGRTVHYAADRFGHEAPFINVAIARLRDKHGLDLDRLVAWLSASPLFPAARLSLAREGLAAWFAGDFVKSTHVLVPQIEAALRDLLSKLGGSVMRSNQRNGGFQAISLGEVLNDEIFRAKVPSDIRFHLQVLYQDARGINLRNEMSHGLAAPELFGLGIANWVVHSIIVIGLIRVRTADSSEEPVGNGPS